MATELRVLIVEDRPADVELIRHALRDDGVAAELAVVETEAAFRAKVGERWDVILSDYSLPQFNARRALALLQEVRADIPFIVVTGSISEEVAVECMKLGAADYLLKDRLTRLGPAVRRAVADAQLRQQRREIEQQLRQSQKMEEVGRLAGGIAHDFNNLLTIIGGYTEMALAKLEPESEVSGDLRHVQAAAARARHLTRQILAFSRKQMLETKVVSLNAEVAAIESMLRRLIGEDIAIETQLAPDLVNVMADGGQLQQVLLNLAVNARDAMPKGGTLTIATANVTAGAVPGLVLDGPPVGECALLTVSDDGCGMTPETLAHLFEPFFTTKPVGQGSGLGLATVFGIVKQHGGHIEVASEVGRGTTFRIYLPATHEPVARDAAVTAPREPGRRSGTILLVEDEQAIRTLVAKLVTRLGFRVLEAASASQGERLVAAHDGAIDLLLTDVVLPGMRGTDLYRRLRTRCPDLKVLFMSGYSDMEIAGADPSLPSQSFLGKPFNLAELTRRIDDLLARP